MKGVLVLFVALAASLAAEPVRSFETTWAGRQSWALAGPGTGVELTASVSGFGLPGLWVGASAGVDGQASWSGEWRALGASGSLKAGLQIPWGRSSLVVPWAGVGGPSWKALVGVDGEVRFGGRLHGVVGVAVASDRSLVVTLGLRDRTSWHLPLPEGPGARLIVGTDGRTLGFEASGGAAAVLWSWSILAPGGQVFYRESGEGPVPRGASWSGLSLWGEAMASATRYEALLRLTDGLGRVTESRASFTTGLFVLPLPSRSLVRIPHPQDEDPAVLGQLVQLLSSQTGTVTISGHTNLTQWLNPARAKEENLNQAIPETRRWALALRDQLRARGIREGQLVAQGEGGNRPLVPFGDEDNAWKNRRLEVSWGTEGRADR